MLLFLLLAPLAGALGLHFHGRAQGGWAGLGRNGCNGCTHAGCRPMGRQARRSPLVWSPLPGAALGLRLDGLGALLALVVSLVGLCIVAYSADYFSLQNREHPEAEGKGRYYFFFLLFVTAMLGMAMAPDFFQIFLFWELTTVCSWALISHYGSRRPSARGSEGPGRHPVRQPLLHRRVAPALRADRLLRL